MPCLVFGQWLFNGSNGYPYWVGQVDRYENIETKAIISYVSDSVKAGGADMRIDWGITHDQSWGSRSYNYILDDAQGWKKLALPLFYVRHDPQGKGFNWTGWYSIIGNDQLDKGSLNKSSPFFYTKFYN